MKTFLAYIFILLSLYVHGQNYTKSRIPCEPVVYPIQFYFVHNHPLLLQNDEAFLYRVIDTLNFYFRPTCIQFQICKIDTIMDYNYFILGDDSSAVEDIEIRTMYYNPKAINIYWVRDENIGMSGSYLGLCEPKRNRPFIFLTSTNFVAPNKTDICVLLYRYFGLNFTASNPASIEFVNGSNSLITADSTWDTPADPGSISFPAPDTFTMPQPPSTSYVYTNRKDPNGDYYNPMVLNPMSIYSLYQKTPYLTQEQYIRIVRNERICRRRFWELE